MSLIDEQALRAIIADEINKALRGESGTAGQPRTAAAEYLPVAQAAEVAAVDPATIRTWIKTGRLKRYHAGRELRVRRAELDRLLRADADGGASDDDMSPEGAANQFLERRRKRPSRRGA